VKQRWYGQKANFRPRVRRAKRQRTGAVQDAFARFKSIRIRASVLECGGPPPLLSVANAKTKFQRHLCPTSIRKHVQAQNFSGLAFDDDLERAAANLAIRREPLRRNARVND
jgi:hypothetical protein